MDRQAGSDRQANRQTGGLDGMYSARFVMEGYGTWNSECCIQPEFELVFTQVPVVRNTHHFLASDEVHIATAGVRTHQ